MKLIAAFALIISIVFAAPAQCDVEIGEASMAVEWDKIFTQSGAGPGLNIKGTAGWTGGDSTYSVLLPNGDTAFFFSDSYIGESPLTKGDGTVTVSATGLRKMQINCLPPWCDPAGTIFAARNSIVVRSADGKRLRTLVGPKNENGLSTSYFAEPAKGLYYWMGDAILAKLDGSEKLIVFLHKFDAKLAFHGASIAALHPTTLKIEQQVDVTGLPDNKIHWGTAVQIENDGIYIYGKGTVDGRKRAFVARTRSTGFAKLADASTWEIWNGNGWAKAIESPAAITPTGDSVSDEFSVEKFSVYGRDIYLMSSLDTSKPMKDWSDLTLYSSCTPEGPFAGRKVIHKSPETGSLKVLGMTSAEKLNSGMVIYNPHIHPQFTQGGKILISYNSNTTNTGDTVFIDTYRPRFIWLPIRGLGKSK